MKSSPLLSKPEFVSQFNVIHLPEYEAAVAKRVHEYFFSHWPWTSQRQKEIYLQKDVEVPMLFTCPRAPEDRAELAAKFNLFCLALDDFMEIAAHDKVAKIIEGIKRVGLEHHRPQNGFENMGHDLCTQMFSFGNEHSRKLANNVWLYTVKWMDAVINHTERREVLEHGLDGYLKFRHEELGMPALYALFAWELDLDTTPDHILSDLDYENLHSLASDHLILMNDMYSYRHEVLLLEDRGWQLDITGEESEIHEYHLFNAVCLLLREDGVDESNVMDRLGTHIHRKESDFLATAEKLRVRYHDRAEDLPIIQTWIGVLTDMMAGNYIWSNKCGRYNKLD